MKIVHIGFHKDIFKPSLLKSIAVFLVFVFAWTNMGLYQAVYAATTSSSQHSVTSNERKSSFRHSALDAESSSQNKSQGIESLVTRIRERAEKTESRVEQSGIESEKAGFQKEKSELEQADINIRAQFKQTEQRIKGLPAVIQQRQKAFERKYEKNLAQLRSELDSINTAKTNTQFTARTRKLKVFLDKIKPPSRHIKLNPNKLPHRMVHPVRRLTFTKLESPDQAIAQSTASSNGVKPVWRSPGKLYSASSFLRKQESRETKDWTAYQVRNDNNNNIGDIPQSVIPVKTGIQNPIQLASLAIDNLLTTTLPYIPPIKGGRGLFVPSPLEGEGQGEGGPSIHLASIGSLNGILSSAIVQTISPPTAADLTSTVEVQFTPAILAKAAQLNHNPVQIYNWVYNNIEYVPTYGSIQGADMCLQTMQCNDMDTASLLIALLRASNIPARYVYGTIQLPINQIMNWVGGFTDAKSAVNLLASGGIPSKTYVAGGQISYVQLEHVWVEAYVPYGNYRGMMSDQSIKTWIPLDGSFKQYQYSQGMDLYSALNIDGTSFINAYITDTTGLGLSPDAQAAINSIIPDFMMSPYQFYSQRLFNYLDATNPTATIDDIIGADTIPDTKVIIQKNFPYLVGGLYYKVISKGGEYDALPSNLLYQLSFNIQDESGATTELTYNTTLPEIAGKRLTLSYIPATSADQALVNQYGSMFSVPAYLLNVEPVLRVNGFTVATGSAVGLGQTQVLNVAFQSTTDTDIETSNVITGEYLGIAIVPYHATVNVAGSGMQTLYSNIGSQDLDALLGQMLYNIGISYFSHLDFEQGLYGKNLQVVDIKQPSEALVSADVIPTYLFGTVSKVDEGGVSIDVKRDIDIPLPVDGNMSRSIGYMNVSGLGSSSWESSILGGFFSVPTVSAVKLLNSAYKQGIPIYTITSGNINTILPQLQVNSGAISAIQDAINAGDEVIISKTNIQYYDWNGVGYIVYDPATGAGGYMISGGMLGAATTKSISLEEANALYPLLCPQKRSIVFGAAIGLLGTRYGFGCKDPNMCTDCPPGVTQCSGIDCSGLVSYAYKQIGVNYLDTDAQGQYYATLPTDYPFYVDLVFFKGAYDKNHDCYVNADDGITHVGLAMPIVLSYPVPTMIAAQRSEGVNIYPIPAISNEYHASGVRSNTGGCKGINPDVGSNNCPGSGICYYWQPTGGIFNPFAGYRYVKELVCP